MNQLHIKRYCCRRMVMSHVDLLEKILRYGLKEQKELGLAGLAWWRKYDEEEGKRKDFQWLVDVKKERGSLSEDYVFGHGKRESREEGSSSSTENNQGCQSGDASANEDAVPFGERFRYSSMSLFELQIR